MPEPRLRVLLVDDEPLVTLGLRSTIDWDASGFLVAGTAQNGAEAIRRIRELGPDIVVTDIRMPGMSGLELMDACRSEGIPAQFIVLSVLDDFDHVREALRMGAVDYLIKSTVNAQALEAALDLARRRSRGRKADPADDGFERGLLELLVDDTTVRQSAVERLSDFFVRHLPSYRVLVLRVDNLFLFRGRHTVESFASFRMALVDMAHRAYPAPNRVIALDEDSFLVLAGNDGRDAGGTRRLELLRRQLRDVFNLELSAGLSAHHTGADQVRLGHREAQQALAGCFFLGPGCNAGSGAFEATQATDARSDEQAEERLRTRIAREAATWDRGGMLAALADCRLLARRLGDQQAVRSLYAAALRILHGHAPAELELRVKSRDTAFRAVLEASDLEALHACVADHFEQLIDAVDEAVRHNSRRPIDKAMEIVHRYFAEDVSLQSVAQRVHVSPGYLSRLFTRIAGTSFTAYLTETRIERAKTLLSGGSMKVSEVAHSVGYADHAYFSRVFRKQTGMSPEEYHRASDSGGAGGGKTP